MLDDRARLLLKALVERYIADGQPVGSRALSKFSGLDPSTPLIASRRLWGLDWLVSAGGVSVPERFRPLAGLQ